jgi:hypothetical protein
MDSMISTSLANSPTNLLQASGIDRKFFDQVSDYVLFFNRDLHAIYLNNACQNFMREPGSPINSLLGKDFFVFAPDFREIGAWDQFQAVSAQGDVFKWNDYTAIAQIYRQPRFVRVQLRQNDELLMAVVTDTTEQIIKEDNIKRQAVRLAELESYINKLKTTIEVLIDRNKEKENEIEKSFICNLENTVFPLLDLLKSSQLNEHQLSLLDVLAANLNSPIDTFLQKQNNIEKGLTAREEQIVNLIRLGKSTKDIANLLCLSTKTVDYHRANVRKKLKLCNTPNDLGSYLRTVIATTDKAG